MWMQLKLKIRKGTIKLCNDVRHVIRVEGAIPGRMSKIWYTIGQVSMAQISRTQGEMVELEDGKPIMP